MERWKRVAKWQENLMYNKKDTLHEGRNDMTNREGKWSMDGALPRRSLNKDFMTSKKGRRSRSWRTHEEEVVDEWKSPFLRGSFDKSLIKREFWITLGYKGVTFVFFNFMGHALDQE